MPRTDPIQLDDALGFVIYRAHQALRLAMYRDFRDVGVDMTPEQWVVLVRLWERDGRTQVELGADTFRDKPTISRMVDAMEARGWVERRTSTEDGRERQVFLTSAGRALEARLVPRARALVERALDGIDPAALRTMTATLRQIVANAS